MEVNRDTGLEPGESETKCLSRLEPGVPIHLHCPDPPCLMVFSFGMILLWENWVLLVQKVDKGISNDKTCFGRLQALVGPKNP